MAKSLIPHWWLCICPVSFMVAAARQINQLFLRKTVASSCLLFTSPPVQLQGEAGEGNGLALPTPV